MKLKKSRIKEIINSDGDLIGADNTPKNGADLETQANGTTDKNAKIGTQPFRYDMLGRFGFTLMPFMEGKENESQTELLNDLAKLMYDKYMETLEYYFRNPNKLKSDYRLHSKDNFESQPKEKKEIDFKWAKKIMNIIQPHFEKAFKEPDNIDESKVVEDKVIEKKIEKEFPIKKDNELKDGKLEKIAGLIKKLDQKDVNKIKSLLEKNDK